MDDEPDEAAARVERAIDSLDQSIRDIRNFIFGLRPELLEQAGLVGGLAALADEFRVNSMIDVELETADGDEPELPPDRAGQLLSIAREALSNIARHSGATRAASASRSTTALSSSIISDNGVGFDPERAARQPGHQGLVNMRARAASIGGRLDVESEPGAGHAYHRARCPVASDRAGSPDARRRNDRTRSKHARCGCSWSTITRSSARASSSLLDRREHFQVVAEAGTAAEAVEMARKFEPDLVVMDVRLPDGSGIEACREIRAELPATRVVILTSYPDEEAVLSAIIAGACGYLLKQIRGRDLVSALESVGRGESLLDPAVTEKVLDRVRRIATGTYTDELAQLTQQEQKILLLVAEGKTNKEIAAEVFLSDKTVKNYVSSILSKLNLERRAQAAAFVAKHRHRPKGGGCSRSSERRSVSPDLASAPRAAGSSHARWARAIAGQ